MHVELTSVWPVLSAAVTLTLVVIALSSGVRRTRGTWLFVLLNVSSALWAVTYFFQINEIRFTSGQSWADSYGIVLLAANGVAVAAIFTFLVLFCAWNSGVRDWVYGPRLALVCVPGVLYAVGQATNPLHGYYISAYEQGVWYTYGWLAYVNHGVAYVMLAVAIAILIRALRRGSGTFRPVEAALVASGIALVMIAGVAWTLRQTAASVVSVNPAVMLFAILAILLAVLTLRSPYGGLLSLQAFDAFDRMSDAALVISSTGRIITFNRAFLIFAPGAEVGRDLAEVNSDLPELLDSIKASTPGESELIAESGVWWVRVVSSPAVDVGDARLVLMTDLTSLRRAESTVAALSQELAAYVCELEDASRVADRRLSELAVVNERLKAATRTKDRFLANVSHELRTPLTSIIGLSSSLEAERLGALTVEQRSFARIIGESGRHLLGLIEDILDLEKAASGVMDVVLSPVEIGAVVRSAAETVKPQFEEQGLYLFVHLPSEPLVIDTDERRVRQILLNLLGNAAKFTSEGGVRVRLDSDEGEALIEVIDSGIGIPADQADRVFQEFEQISRADGSKSAGAGLGLSISRRLAELLGGSLQVESEPGQGSRFALRLPLSKYAYAAPGA